jgi:isoleucyl-tRNA synthetase
LSEKIKAENVLDRWLLSRIANLQKQLVKYLERFDVMRASRLLAPFISDFSTWYLRLSRDRLKSAENQEVSQVFASVLYFSAQLFAPIVPFFTEFIHQQLVDQESSIHLTDYPKLPQAWIEDDLEEQMQELRQLVELGHAQRKKAQISLRQPLALVKFNKKASFSEDEELLTIIKQELNVKEVSWGQATEADFEAEFDLELTVDLLAEGEARQIIRRIQNWRKDAGLDVNQEVPVYLKTWPNQFTKMIEEKTNSQLVRAQIEGLKD